MNLFQANFCALKLLKCTAVETFRRPTKESEEKRRSRGVLSEKQPSCERTLSAAHSQHFLARGESLELTSCFCLNPQQLLSSLHGNKRVCTRGVCGVQSIIPDYGSVSASAFRRGLPTDNVRAAAHSHARWFTISAINKTEQYLLQLGGLFWDERNNESFFIAFWLKLKTGTTFFFTPLRQVCMRVCIWNLLPTAF